MLRASLVMTVLLTACTSRPPRPVSPPPAAERYERFLGFDQITTVMGVDPIDEATARGIWHWLFRIRGGKVVEARLISPKGVPLDKREYVYLDDGGLRVLTYDAYGELESTHVVDTSGREIITWRSGVVNYRGCHHIRMLPDARGYIRELLCLDAAEQPLAAVDGCARIVQNHNERGHTVSRACFKPDGAKATFDSGEHERREATNKIGLVTEMDYLGIDGKPREKGCAHATFEHDVTGHISRRRCVDRDGVFVDESRFRYNEAGCVTAKSYVDEHGKPRLFGGVASIHYRTNDRCSDLREEKRGVHGELVSTPAIREYELDKLGRVSTERCRDTESKPVSCWGQSSGETNGAIVRYDYDDKSRQIRRRCYNAGAFPSPCSTFYPFEQRTTYGSDGRSDGVAFFGTHGKPILALGAARIAYTRDAMGTITAERFFGEDGEPVLATLGCHEVRSVYDAHHRLSAVECRDIDGSLRIGQICRGGVCFAKDAVRVIVEREPEGKTLNVHYDVAGKEVARVSCDTSPCFR